MKNSCYFVIINTAFLHKSLWNHSIIDSFCFISVVYCYNISVMFIAFSDKSESHQKHLFKE